jgi:hypothetical protein
MMAKIRTPEVEGAVVKTIQHRIEEVNHELRKILESMEYYQRKYGLKTEEFYEGFLKGELGDDMDFFEWKACKEIYDELRKERGLLLKAIK